MTLVLESPYGTWRQAPVNPLRVMKPNGVAVDVLGRNKYTSQPVSVYGLTFEAWQFCEAHLVAFPDSPTKRNYAVDRNQRGTSNLSDHAKGEASDIISQKYDGKLGISAADLAWGTKVFDWAVAQMRVGPSGVGYNGRPFMGNLRICYVLYNGRIARASEQGRVRPINSGDPHRDHLHITIVPADRRKMNIPPQEARRVLRLKSPKMKGDDVKLVQEAVGAKVYPPGIGVYGPATKSAVELFQIAHALPPDGIVGPLTWAKIDKVTTQ